MVRCGLRFVQTRGLKTCVTAQHIAANLIIGHMHNIISRTQYEKVRALVGIFNLHLPHWTTLFKNKASVRETLKIELNETTSVFGNKCFSLRLKDILSLVMLFIFGYVFQHTLILLCIIYSET